MNRKGLSVEATLEFIPGKEQPCANTRGIMFQADKAGSAKALGRDDWKRMSKGKRRRDSQI